MLRRNLFDRVLSIYKEYPSQFWALIGVSFIDMLGSTLLFPFFTLYITGRFNVGMTQVGVVFGMMSIFGMVGSTFGGALADRFGRKRLVLFGLLASGASSLLMGFINRFELFYLAAVIVGLLSSVGGPARSAMIADILPEEKRAAGFGLHRVAFNLSATIGPAIGGFLASRSYFLLFVIDAVASTITGIVIFLILKETLPVASADDPSTSTLEVFRGYGKVLRDRIFMIFLFATMLMALGFIQMNGTLAVFLRDVHGLAEQKFGYILTLNASIVVLFQFAVTRRVEGKPQLYVLAAGTLVLVVGFTMYGFVSGYSMFLLAMVVITLGEMLIAPVGQAVASSLAPDDMRGRYMAMYGLSWAVPNAVGLTLAGLIMDYSDPRLVWYATGLLGLVASFTFGWMHVHRMTSTPSPLRMSESEAEQAVST
jgi:MFS family permease